MLDTGADKSVLPLALAPLLGIESAQLAREQGQQVVGSMDVWSTTRTINARVSGLANEFDLNPIFIQAVQTPLLGRFDFMSVWAVGVNERTQQFSLEYLG